MITVSSDVLLKAIDIINLVPARAGIVPSEFVQIEKKKNKLFFSLASEVYGRTFATIKEYDGEDWVFHVDRLALIPFVQASNLFKKKSDFTFEFKKKKNASSLIVKSGRRKVVFNAITFIKGYPKYKETEAVAVALSNKQKTLLALASKYATPDSTLPYINCVYMIKGKAVMASNKITLFTAEENFPITLPLPLVLLQLLDSPLVKNVEVSDTVVRLKFDCGYICQAINLTAKKDFPVKQATNQFNKGLSYPLQFSIPARKLINPLSRLEVYVKAGTQREILVYLKASKDSKKLTVYATTPQGVFSEILFLEQEVKRDFTIEWLLPAVTVLDNYSKLIKNIDVRFDDKSGSPYHLIMANGVQVMLSRRV